MRYDAFVDRVAERAGLSDRSAAGRTAVAVLQHLCDRLTGDEAHDLLAQLPYRLKTAVIVSPRRAADLGGRVRAQGRRGPECLARRGDEPDPGRLRDVPPGDLAGEFDDVLTQLDPEYADLPSVLAY